MPVAAAIIPIAHTPVQAAIVSGRTRTRIFGAIKAGELAAKKDGRATLIEDTELRRWIANMPTISRRPEKAA